MALNLTNGTDELSGNDDCVEIPVEFIEFKLLFVGVFGLSVAALSVVENLLLFFVFSRSQLLRRRNFTYLTWISLCDIFISVSYVAIMCVSVYAEYFRSVFLFVTWHEYLRAFFAISHVTLSSSSFLLMAATIERYLQSVGNVRFSALSFFLSQHRGAVVVSAFVLGLLIRGTVFFEIAIVHVEGCEGFASVHPMPAPLTSSEQFNTFWKLWFRKITTVFLPFAALAYFNAAIVISVRRADKGQTVRSLILYVTVGAKAEVCRVRSRVRSATRMLVMVVSCYLGANIIDVVVTAWEYLSEDSLRAFPIIYEVITDVSSLLPIVAAASRLPIYVSNDSAIRREVKYYVKILLYRLCHCVPCTSELLTKRKNVDRSENNTLLALSYARKVTEVDNSGGLIMASLGGQADVRRSFLIRASPTKDERLMLQSLL